MIYPGQELVIPAGGTPPESETLGPPSRKRPATPATSAQPSTHTVKRGETLFSIAQQYNVPVESADVGQRHRRSPLRVHSGLVLRVKDLESASSAVAIRKQRARRPVVSAVDYDCARAIHRAAGRVPVDHRLEIRHELAGDRGDQRHQQPRLAARRHRATNPDARRSRPIRSGPSCQNRPRRAHRRWPRIVIVLSTQTAYAYENGVLQRSAIISSGLPDTPTVTG